MEGTRIQRTLRVRWQRYGSSWIFLWKDQKPRRFSYSPSQLRELQHLLLVSQVSYCINKWSYFAIFSIFFYHLPSSITGTYHPACAAKMKTRIGGRSCTGSQQRSRSAWWQKDPWWSATHRFHIKTSATSSVWWWIANLLQRKLPWITPSRRPRSWQLICKRTWLCRAITWLSGRARRKKWLAHILYIL